MLRPKGINPVHRRNVFAGERPPPRPPQRERAGVRALRVQREAVGNGEDALTPTLSRARERGKRLSLMPMGDSYPCFSRLLGFLVSGLPDLGLGGGLVVGGVGVGLGGGEGG